MEEVKVARRVDYRAGIKGGLVAGLVAEAFFLPVNLLSLYLGDPSRPDLYRVTVAFAESDIPFALALGVIIGIVFAATQGRFLKGLALELKGMIYSMAYWLLVTLPYILLQPLLSQFFFSSVDFPISIAGYLILGLVLGNFYRRFTSRPHNTVPSQNGQLK